MKSNKFTIDSTGKFAGFLCEEIFVEMFGGKVAESYDYDVDIPGFGKIDIKTKRCNSEPTPEYSCSVSAYQKDRQKCDHYVFFRALYDLSNVWLLGAISKKEFFEKAVLIKAGEKDGQFIANSDMYSLPISELYDCVELFSESN